MTILDKIIADRKNSIKEYRLDNFTFQSIPIPRPSIYDRIMNSSNVQVIAELKRASPSKGDIAVEINLVEQAKKYEASNAACISVLTENLYFKGSYEDLNEVAQNVSIPILCKDFIVSKIQIDIAKKAGASVILLIVAALSKEKLKELFDYAKCLQLEVLMEVHTVDELKIALSTGAKIIGVNNRNLKTFEVDLKHTAEIAKHLEQSDAVLVSESGIASIKDVENVASHGAKAILVGETLMKSKNVEETLQSFQIPFLVGGSI